MLLYALIHLAGVEQVDQDGTAAGRKSITLEQIRQFRQWGSPCAGHPEYRHASGIETTTGPLGQGVATSVGMAMASRWSEAYFRRPGFDLFGYDTSADDTGAASYVSDGACRCSREWLGIALSAATQAKRLAIVSHNFSSSAVVTLYRHTSDDLSAATAVDTVTYDANFMVVEFDATYRYWWIHVDDIDNSDSYIEIGRAFLGDYDIAEYMELGMELAMVDPSEPTMTPEGYVGRNERTQFKRVNFNFAMLSETDRDNLIAIYETIGAFNHFFFIPDPAKAIFTQSDLGGMYGYFLSKEVPIAVVSGATTWTTSGLTFEEAR